MYGWRARIGLIIPSANTTNESEWSKHMPHGVSLHSARMEIHDANIDNLNRMVEDYERAAELLGTADVDIVAFGCTTGSLFKGPGYDEEIEANLRERAGVPGVATSASIRRAFDALDMERLAVATPYIDEMNEAVIEFLEGYGYEVQELQGLGVEEATGIGNQGPENTYQWIRDDLDYDGADGVFISCTDFRTFEIIEPLEADLGVPVVSSNLATLWDALRNTGVDYSDVGVGSLFEQ